MGARSRNFGTIVYPESAPDGWQQYLKNLQTPGFISPLHDFDVFPDTGELKKPHHHVLLRFPGKKSIEQMKMLFSDIGGVGIEVIQDFNAYARYLCHLDEKDKAQYSVDKVVELGGADYAKVIADGADRIQTYIEITKWIDEQSESTTYKDVVQYARRENRLDWFKMLLSTSGGNAITRYLWRRPGY